MNLMMTSALRLVKQLARTGVALTLTGAAFAQTTLYRCGVDGSSYSQSPCAHGRAVAVDDTRSANQRRQALVVSQREQALAQQMRDQRLADEARFKPAGPAGIRHAAADASNMTPKAPRAERADKEAKKSHDKRQVQKDPRLTWQVKLAAPRKERSSGRSPSVKR